MKEDVLEQVVDDYLQSKGYFTRHNIRFRPRKDHPEFVSSKDSVPSDIDVLGYNPLLRGVEKVVVVSCKAHQEGFNPESWLAALKGDKTIGGRKASAGIRELWVPKWNEAFREEIRRLTKAEKFSYRIAVTHLTGKVEQADSQVKWMANPTIARNLSGCNFGFLTLEKMWREILASPEKTPAPSEIGRLAQLLKAAGLSQP